MNLVTCRGLVVLADGTYIVLCQPIIFILKSLGVSTHQQCEYLPQLMNSRASNYWVTNPVPNTNRGVWSATTDSGLKTMPLLDQRFIFRDPFWHSSYLFTPERLLFSYAMIARFPFSFPSRR